MSPAAGLNSDCIDKRFIQAYTLRRLKTFLCSFAFFWRKLSHQMQRRM